jgi:hypothetical protein
MKINAYRNVLTTLTLMTILAFAARASDDDDQSQFPVITQQPTDDAIGVGSTTSFSVQATNGNSYQWLRNGAVMEGKTNSSLVLENVGTNDVGLYACQISKDNGETVPTRTANLNVFMTMGGGGPITVFGTPVSGGGGSPTNSCPGVYVGYVNYVKTASQGWGWVPTAGTTLHTATDTNRTDTKVYYLGRYGDSGCNQTTVTVPHPTASPKYRFTVFFTNNVPTNPYPIVLDGFDP